MRSPVLVCTVWLESTFHGTEKLAGQGSCCTTTLRKLDRRTPVTATASTITTTITPTPLKQRVNWFCLDGTYRVLPGDLVTWGGGVPGQSGPSTKAAVSDDYLEQRATWLQPALTHIKTYRCKNCRQKSSNMTYILLHCSTGVQRIRWLIRPHAGTKILHHA